MEALTSTRTRENDAPKADENRKLLDALYSQPRSNVKLTRSGGLPPIAFGSAPEHPLPPAATYKLLDLLAQPRGPRRDEVLAQAKRLLDPDAMDRLVAVLFPRWNLARHPGPSAWIRCALETFGGDRTALALAEGFEWWSAQRETRRRRAVLMMDALVAIDTDAAVMILHDLTHVQDVSRVWERAGNLVEVVARRRRVTAEELGDLTVPRVGLERHGRSVFEAGGRRLVLTLDTNLEPRCVDADTGERLAFPSEVVEDAGKLEDWAHMVRLVERTVAIQNRRMEDAMVHGRRWTQGEWMESLFDHPLMINYARRLVWGLFDADDDLVATFRAAEDRTLVDVEDETFVMPGGLRVGLVHPLHLGKELRAAWSQSFGDYEIFSPIDQLGRSTFDPPAGRYDGVTFSGEALRARMKRNLWRHAKGSHMKFELTRRFGQGVRVSLRLSKGFETWRKGAYDQRVEEIKVTGGEGVGVDIAWSETVRTLEEVLGHVPGA